MNTLKSSNSYIQANKVTKWLFVAHIHPKKLMSITPNNPNEHTNHKLLNLAPERSRTGNWWLNERLRYPWLADGEHSLPAGSQWTSRTWRTSRETWTRCKSSTHTAHHTNAHTRTLTQGVHYGICYYYNMFYWCTQTQNNHVNNKKYLCLYMYHASNSLQVLTLLETGVKLLASQV